MLQQNKLDISDSIEKFDEIGRAIKGLQTIAYYSDTQITAADFSPMLEQLAKQIRVETKTLRKLCGVEK